MATLVQRATLALLLTVAFADGDLDDEEFKILSRRIPDHPLFEDLSEDQVRKTNLSIIEEINRSSLADVLMRYAREIPPSISLQVFKLVLDIMYADGRVDDNEAAAVLMLKQSLGISSDEFKEAVDRAKRRAEY
ncbi:MAG: tellurite resistance TerB family protein [Hyphomonadaceae bacterium]